MAKRRLAVVATGGRRMILIGDPSIFLAKAPLSRRSYIAVSAWMNGIDCDVSSSSADIMCVRLY
jgi:hypothetical protein